MVDIPLSKISKDVKEGDVLKDNGNGVSYTVDAAMTKQRRDEIDTLFEKLKTKNKK
ncbi:MAG: DUF3006 domain-containing protein [Candidatus Bathyarchaeota archaeon]|nr:DUF3006 domain-containing protein [Candidatus Termiticorpusculum sp.]